MLLITGPSKNVHSGKRQGRAQLEEPKDVVILSGAFGVFARRGDFVIIIECTANSGR